MHSCTKTYIYVLFFRFITNAYLKAGAERIDDKEVEVAPLHKSNAGRPLKAGITK
jgi:hypothetical protein